MGTASAEPLKNQVLVPATCDNGQSYTVVINAMSKVGQIVGNNGNITVTYFDQDGNLVWGRRLRAGQ